MEETTIFPQVEAITGEKGLMDVNVEQHRKSSLRIYLVRWFYDYLPAWESLSTSPHIYKPPSDYEGPLMFHTDAFLPGLTAFENYLTASAAAPETFSGIHLNTLIDAFGSILVEHLTDEIPSLLALSRFESSLPLLTIGNKEAQKASAKLAKTRGSSFFFRNLDLEYVIDYLSLQFVPVVYSLRLHAFHSFSP